MEKAEHDLAETKRDLEVYKKAFCIAERDRHDLEERFEREKQSLNDEICQLRENEARVREERFEQEKQALNEGIFQLKVRSSPPHVQCKVGCFEFPRDKSCSSMMTRWC